MYVRILANRRSGNAFHGGFIRTHGEELLPDLHGGGAPQALLPSLLPISDTTLHTMFALLSPPVLRVCITIMEVCNLSISHCLDQRTGNIESFTYSLLPLEVEMMASANDHLAPQSGGSGDQASTAQCLTHLGYQCVE